MYNEFKIHLKSFQIHVHVSLSLESWAYALFFQTGLVYVQCVCTRRDKEHSNYLE